MSQKDIIFPHFLHCCQETKDVFWKYIFEDLSCGRAPYGVYFTNCTSDRTMIGSSSALVRSTDD